LIRCSVRGGYRSDFLLKPSSNRDQARRVAGLRTPAVVLRDHYRAAQRGRDAKDLPGWAGFALRDPSSRGKNFA